MFVVVLSSMEYGSETFEYATEKEALAGLVRLRKKADLLETKDGIMRNVIYVGDQG